MATTKSKRTKVSKAQALTSCGTHLKKGYVYGKGGVVYKVTPPAKKAPAKKKSGSGLGRVPVCQRRNPDNSTTQYSQQGGSNPCPYGGRLTGPGKSKKKPAAKKTIRKHEGINQKTGRLKKGYRYGSNGTIVKAKS